MVIGFTDTIECSNASQPMYTMRIVNSYTAYGVNVPGLLGSGLTIVLAQTTFGVHIDVDNLTSVGNTARIGANTAFRVYDVVDNSSITVRNSLIKHANPFLEFTVLGNYAEHIGGGLHYEYGRPIPTDFTTTCPVGNKHLSDILIIFNSTFVGNTAGGGGGVRLLFVLSTPADILYHIHVTNCTFDSNVGCLGSAVSVYEQQRLIPSRAVLFIFEYCSFINNFCPSLLQPTSVKYYENDVVSAVQLTSVQDVTILHCHFEANMGTALDAYSTNVRLHAWECLFCA